MDTSDQYAEDGVDVTLIRWFLTLTPAERLTALEEHLDDLEKIRLLNHDKVSRSPEDADHA
jgi:hypothetical protein